MESQRVSVSEAARILGMSPDTVRYRLKKGDLPIGDCCKSRSGNTNRFYIFRSKLEEYIGGKA